MEIEIGHNFIIRSNNIVRIAIIRIFNANMEMYCKNCQMILSQYNESRQSFWYVFQRSIAHQSMGNSIMSGIIGLCTKDDRARNRKYTF